MVHHFSLAHWGGGMLMFAFVLAAYLVPTIIAMGRSHHNRWAIGALNLLLGWTALGWIAAFVWSLTSVRTYRTPA